MIAIIAILASMFLPALSMAKNHAKDILCKGNLKQLGVLDQTYASNWNAYLPPVRFGGANVYCYYTNWRTEAEMFWYAKPMP